MDRPQLYNVELSNGVKDNKEYICAISDIYDIPKEMIPELTENINKGKKTVIACLPLDIAKTLSDIFINFCNENHYTYKIDLQLSGKYGE